MLINVGIRTDIVNHYTEWLYHRFKEGFAYSRNPLFPSKVTRYELTPDKVDAVLFCSKNYAPALPRLHEITGKFHSLFHYTLTPYGKDLEPNIPDRTERVKTLCELSRLVGRERLVWRYDPVLLTRTYSVEYHLEAFAELAERISPFVSRCIFHFVEVFPKLNMYLPQLITFSEADKRRLAEGMGKIAAKNGLLLQTCFPDKTRRYEGVITGACTTLNMIGLANGCSFREVPHKGNKRGCSCIESRDLGWYDTCPNGCRYCNVNHDVEKIKKNRKLHDPHSPILIGNLSESDTVMEGNQPTYITHDSNQMSLFNL